MDVNVTIGAILTLPELRECRLLCDEVSCFQTAESVTIMDNPDILDWMSDYEILLSNGSSLADLNVVEWKTFLAGLVAKKSAALFIKLNYYIQTIPEEVVAYSQKLDFPIVVVPNSYSWVRLSTPIQEFMIEKQFYFLNESLNLRNELNRAMAHGGTAVDVCAIAAKDMGCETAFFSSETWEVLGGTNCGLWDDVAMVVKGPNSLTDGRVQAGPLPPSSFTISMPAGEMLFTRLPDRLGKYYSAYYIESPKGDAVVFDTFKIEQVNSALLLCVCKDEELKRIERHYYADFLLELLDGSLTIESEINAKAKRLGRAVHGAYQLIVVEIDSDMPTAAPANLVARFKQNVNPAIRDTMYCVKDSRMILFCPVFALEDRSAISGVCETVKDSMHMEEAYCGVSRPCSIHGIHEAYGEASFAYSLHIFSNSSIVYYGDLGLLRLLERNAHCADTRFISDFYEQVMGPLIRYDADCGSNLTETIQAYFLYDCSISETSKALYIHENTLRMRIKRVENLTNRSLKSTIGATELYLGVIVHNFIGA